MLSNFIEIVGITDPGSVRQFNEDNVVYDPDDGVMVLADGMGGHRAGEVASRMATEIIIERLRTSVAEFGSSGDQHLPQLAVKQSINRANDAVFEAAEANPAYHGMGTTLVLAVFYDNRVTLAHVGDSRIYRLRNGRLELLTRDDSLLREQIELGMISAADARGSHNRNLVTRALGIEKQVSAHVREDEALPGDVFLLCSDGFHNYLTCEEELAQMQCDGAAGGGLVTATVNGQFEVVRIKIDKSVVDPNDVGMLEDLVTAAINAAATKVREESKQKMQSVMGGMGGMPGMPGLF